jgi:hypothetical protein
MLALGVGSGCGEPNDSDGPDAAQTPAAGGTHWGSETSQDSGSCGIFPCEGSVGTSSSDAATECEVLRWEREDGGALPCHLTLPSTAEETEVIFVRILRSDTIEEALGAGSSAEGCGTGDWYVQRGQVVFCDDACARLQEAPVDAIDLYVGPCVIDPPGS